MKEKLMRFMYGRYGIDSFGKCTIGVGLVAIVLSNFVNYRIGSVLSFIAWVCIIYSYFRMFSKNTYKRATENQAYLAKTYKIRCFFARQKNMMAQKKTHHIYKCPSCKQKIRIPKGKGRIEIRCPKCSTTFIKKS